MLTICQMSPPASVADDPVAVRDPADASDVPTVARDPPIPIISKYNLRKTNARQEA